MRTTAWIVTAAALLAPLAHAADTPVVVEVFTSKYCPNCPAAERKLTEMANEDPGLLVVFEHVDYWDRGDRKDPLGLASVTQRQYDYSNTLGRRPGEVFTPMPLLDGRVVAAPPLWLHWDDALEQARAAEPKAALEVVKKADGSLAVSIPATVAVKHTELWLIGLDPVAGSKAWTARGITLANIDGNPVTVPAALVPKGKRVLALLQKTGPTAALAMGMSR